MRPKPTRCRYRRRSPIWRWMRRRASAAARAWPSAKTPARCCSSRRRFPTSIIFRRARPKGPPGQKHGAAEGREGFGNCTVTGSCEAVCPKEISLDFIAKMNRDYAVAVVKGELKESTRRSGIEKFASGNALCSFRNAERCFRALQVNYPSGVDLGSNCHAVFLGFH